MKFVYLLIVTCLTLTACGQNPTTPVLAKPYASTVVHDTESFDLHTYPAMKWNEDTVWVAGAYWTTNENAKDTDFTDLVFNQPRGVDSVYVSSHNNSTLYLGDSLAANRTNRSACFTNQTYFVRDKFGYKGKFRIMSITIFNETNVRTARVILDRYMKL